jgi:acyl carrier protein
MISIIKNILDVQSIDVEENFFNFGGHSVLAVEIFGAINEQFNINIPLSAVFESGTIKSLSEIIDN